MKNEESLSQMPMALADSSFFILHSSFQSKHNVFRMGSDSEFTTPNTNTTTYIIMRVSFL